MIKLQADENSNLITFTYTSSSVTFNCNNCGTQCTVKKGVPDAIMSATFCQTCDEQYWIRWSEGVLRKGAYVMKWSEMSTGKRDRLMHEKVMGKPVKCTGRAETIMVKNPSRVIGEYFEYAKWYCESCGRSGDSLAPVEHDLPGGIPSYSTDMNALWQAVTKLYTKENFDNFSMSYREDIQLYSACFTFVNKSSTRVRYPYNHFIYEGKILEDAIIIAMLRAVGVEIEP